MPQKLGVSLRKTFSSHMKRFPAVPTLTPDGFERQVKAWIESVAGPLESFNTKHLEDVSGADGDYTIDVTARFTAFGGASFLLLVECKRHKNPIKREVVQILRDKLQSVGAQKAMVVSTSDFQSGAIEYAKIHGIALIQIVNGQAAYIQNSIQPIIRKIPDDAEDYAGFFFGENPDGNLFFPQLITTRHNLELARFLCLEA
jgi:restriction system protein